MTIEIRHLSQHKLTVAYKQLADGKYKMAFAWAAEGDQWCRRLGKTIATNRLECPKGVVKHVVIATNDAPKRPPKMNLAALDKENLLKYQASLDSWMFDEWCEDLHQSELKKR